MREYQNLSSDHDENLRRSIMDFDETEEKFNVKDLSISENGIEFIKSYEAFKSELYNDATGNATIGYGHLVHTGKINGTDPSETDEFKKGITEERATEILKEDMVSKAENPVKSGITVELTQNQFDALVSIVFNIGSGNFADSTLKTRVNKGDETAESIKEAFLMWNKGTVNGKKQELKGLTSRRTAEANIYNNNVYENHK